MHDGAEMLALKTGTQNIGSGFLAENNFVEKRFKKLLLRKYSDDRLHKRSRTIFGSNTTQKKIWAIP